MSPLYEATGRECVLAERHHPNRMGSGPTDVDDSSLEPYFGPRSMALRDSASVCFTADAGGKSLDVLDFGMVGSMTLTHMVLFSYLQGSEKCDVSFEAAHAWFVRGKQHMAQRT